MTYQDDLELLRYDMRIASAEEALSIRLCKKEYEQQRDD